ncbi:uncharacterized protein RJT20DRAFT_137611 [Scheffersomyces xylosifermentans]|uniref:uncharacterized protein n=1 Tax=Scheffersomyces xylosifermentans TaxID=1304137 RepID=UPI00315D9795
MLGRSSIDRRDPLGNIGRTDPRNSSRSSQVLSFPPIIEDANEFDTGYNQGNTFCRVEYYAARSFPNLNLPYSTVFVKVYSYDKKWWMAKRNDIRIFHEIPSADKYYDMFYVERDINARIAVRICRQFCRNSSHQAFGMAHMTSRYIYSSILGKKYQKMRKVGRVIRSGLKELHSLGISHNDMRIPNIHVSRSEKISLIDFGLSDSSNSESHKKRDFEILDDILGIYGDDDDGDEDTS